MKELFARISDSGINLPQLFIFSGAVLVALLLLALISKSLFGKNSIIMGTVSSTFTVFFIYFTAIFISFPVLTSPLPIIEINNSTLHLYRFNGDYFILASHALRFLLLAFYAALANQFLPKGKLLWPVFRILSIAIVWVLYCLTVSIISTVLTPVITKYSPVILLSVLMLLLGAGSLRFLVGAAISAVNPIVAALFTFFFVTIIGKQIVKALLVTVIFAIILLICQQLGISAFPVSSLSLTVGIPIAVGAGVLWYFIG